MKRRLLSVFIALTLLLSLSIPALAVSGKSFTDISDAETARCAEVLRQLGVIDGVAEGRFAPNGTLTRAQFCKMAVIIMGSGSMEPSCRNRTIFTDVSSTHWARGYINLAASGEGAIITGIGGGKFSPDTNITFAQAVTILVRLLGYSDSDTSMQWPTGYLNLASSIGLTSNISLEANSAITRGQAAKLFCDMLTCYTKNGSQYLSRFGTMSDEVIILNTSASAPDGSPAVYTSNGLYKTDIALSEAFVGTVGTFLTGSNGKLLLFMPSESSSRTVKVSSVSKTSLTGADGSVIRLSETAAAYTASEALTWADIWYRVKKDTEIRLYFDARGNVSTVFYVPDSADNTVVFTVLGADESGFTDSEKQYFSVDGNTPVLFEGITTEWQDIAAVIRKGDSLSALIDAEGVIKEISYTGSYEKTSITVKGVNSASVTASSETYKLSGDTAVITASGIESWSDIWYRVKTDSALTLCSDARGNTVFILYSPSEADTTVTLTVNSADSLGFNDSTGSRYILPSGTAVYLNSAASSWSKVYQLLGEDSLLSVVFNSKGKILSVSYTLTEVRKTVRVTAVESTWFKDTEGSKYTVASGTPVYMDGTASSWQNSWLDIEENSALEILFNSDNSIKALYYTSSDSGISAAAALNEVKGNPFTSLLNGASDYTILKNGAPASVNDIRRYDVAEYDSVTATLKISDFKLTGYYEAASPSLTSPEKVTLLGHTFEVLPCCQEAFAGFRIGDKITLLFSSEMKVAGVVSARECPARNIGLAKSYSDGYLTIRLFTSPKPSLELVCKPASSAASYTGKIVSFTVYEKDCFNVSLASSESSGALSLSSHRLGDTPVSSAVKIYEKVGSSDILRVDTDSISASVLESASVIYAGTDYKGTVDTLILGNISGDLYTYGFIDYSLVSDYSDLGELVNYKACVRNSDGTSAQQVYPTQLPNGAAGGLIYSSDGSAIVSSVILTKLGGISRTSFKTENGSTYLTANGMKIPVADNVQCYNKTTDTWFSSLNEARAYSRTLTVYYDREPSLGGKVRMVVAE